MTIFLFLKQIVDMFYTYKVLDYLMVIFVILLCLYQLALVRPSVKRLQPVDGLVVLLMLVFTISFLKNINGYQNYFKIMSACLVYFLGRLYSERIKECYGALVASSYIVVYLNFLHRIFRQQFKFFSGFNQSGEYFYYKTDLAFAMLLAAIFIYYLARRTILKYITLIFIIPYMVLYSAARTQQVLIFMIYFLFVIAHKERNVEEANDLNWKWLVTMSGILFIGVCFLLLAPYMDIFQKYGMRWGLDISHGLLTEPNMQVRYYAWKDTLYGIIHSDWSVQLFGRDLISDSLYNRYGFALQSLYIKAIFSVGYIGSLICLMLVVSYVLNLKKLKKDRRTFYLALSVGLLFMGSGLTVCAHEFTQMSWFPMIFFGMVITGLQPEEETNE